MFLRIFYKIQEALIYYHKYSLHGTGFQNFFQKVLRYGDPCRIIGITQENNIRLFFFSEHPDNLSVYRNHFPLSDNIC